MSEILLPTLSSRSFMILGFTFKSNPFWVYSCIWCKRVIWFLFLFFFASICPIFLAPFIDECLYCILRSCLLCQVLIDHIVVGLFPGSVICSIDLCACFYASAMLKLTSWLMFILSCMITVQCSSVQSKKEETTHRLFQRPDCFRGLGNASGICRDLFSPGHWGLHCCWKRHHCFRFLTLSQQQLTLSGEGFGEEKDIIANLVKD